MNWKKVALNNLNLARQLEMSVWNPRMLCEGFIGLVSACTEGAGNLKVVIENVSPQDQDGNRKGVSHLFSQVCA